MEEVIQDPWPAEPEDNEDWPIYHALHACAVEWGVDIGAKEAYQASRRTLLIQMHLMLGTRCHACGGFAHRSLDCPTHARLSMLGKCSEENAKLIAWTRKKVACRMGTEQIVKTGH